MTKESGRLPRSVLPSSYHISLKPDLTTCTFAGKLSVKLNVTEPVNEILLNAAALTIANDTVSLRLPEPSKVLQPTVELIPDDELLILTLNETLPAGEATLFIEFKGTLNDHMKGFYRSTYVVAEETRNMAVTQFEPADARRCFPCWDEPSFKAAFKIVVEAPHDRVVLSNMPVVSEQVTGSSKIVEFDETPVMSTYLVAIVVGEFDYLEGTTRDGTKVRVYTKPDKVEQGKFALDVALETLPFFTEYFETPYPLPKMDMIAIPDFAAGAMENYGLVTYREASLLFDEKHSSSANKQAVAVVVAHELAHQWFGNLVTMEWWTHLWLNEGFATWVSYLAVDRLFPDWKVWTRFNEFTAGAFGLDALVESHPIEVEVRHVRQIDEIFDAISYQKGASIIHMLQNYLGAEVFQKGLASYIRKFAYTNAMTEDLWDSLSEVSGQPVRELMNSWTKQKGYPVVTVKLVGDVLKLQQSQFLLGGQSGTGEWVLPITLCCNSYENRVNALVRGKSGDVSLSEVISRGHPDKKWVKVNVGQTGFYRVHYDEHLFGSLRSVIGSLQAADRYGVLNDNFALCKACKQPLRILLSLMEAYGNEADPTVLSILISVARSICTILVDATPSILEEAKALFTRLLLVPARTIGWDAVPGEGNLISVLRGDLLSALVTFGHEKTINEAKSRFEAFLSDRETTRVSADIRPAVYRAVMRGVTDADKSGYEALLRIYRETDLSQERTRILGSLASAKDSSVVRDVLDFIFTPEVRNQDAVYVLSGVSVECRETAWIWLKDNWDTIRRNWGEGFLITRFVSSSTSKFASQERADEIEEFFAKNGTVTVERTVGQSIEQVRINARWVEFIREETGLKELISELAQG